MNNLTQKLGAIAILPVLFCGVIGQKMARADSVHDHPYYLHARSDLRRAEALLKLPDERNVKREEDHAAWEVRSAIREIDLASIIDRKDLDDHPPIDVSLNHQGKFSEIERLLHSAKRDISRDEDNRFAASWRRRAAVHIAKAEQRIAIAARQDHADDSREYEH